LIKNRIISISKLDLIDLKNKYERNKCVFFLEIDGKIINNWEDYADYMNHHMEIPVINPYSKDAYLDWMTDLSWLDADEYIIVINNFEEFMKNNLEEKDKVLKMFETNILPFWEKEVESVTAGGIPKKFNVYLVD